ncbi:uncharacterized protein LOC136078351 isoform X2 [Hydra vulgaris]|uniref:Uncharacterized protein LOC136078351 isoform X2 n=1 Tax=Hydra vulgaris TaxID=6087 RepID=A0ABM4BLZ7_HYDVU
MLEISMTSLSLKKTSGVCTSSVQTVNTENIQQELTEAFNTMSILIEKHSSNAAFLKGVSKLCTRLKQNETNISNLSSSLHCFGIDFYQSRRVVNTTLRKKSNGVKIKVQPEAVKRRKIKNGSKASIQKGMVKRNNPFNVSDVSTKRAHSFSECVKDNVAVSKKAGITMGSKTKLLSSKLITMTTKSEERICHSTTLT